MDWIRLWITCTGMATHSCWSAWNNSSTFTGVFTLPQTRLSNSSQVYSTGSKLIWAHGRPGENLDIGVGEELCGISLLHGVWHCHVEIQRHTTFEAKNKTAKKCVSILEQHINSWTKKWNKCSNNSSSKWETYLSAFFKFLYDLECHQNWNKCVKLTSHCLHTN